MIDDRIYFLNLNTTHCNHIACISIDMKLIPSTYQSYNNNLSTNPQDAFSYPLITPYPPFTVPSPFTQPPLNKTAIINYLRMLLFVVDLGVVYCFAGAYMHVIDCLSYKMVRILFELAIFILIIRLPMTKQIQYWCLGIRNVIEFWILWNCGDSYRSKRIQCDTNFNTIINHTEYKIGQSYIISYDQHSEMILARINYFYVMVIVVKTINAICMHKVDTSINSDYKFNGNTNIWYTKAIIALMIINDGKFSMNIHSIDSFYVRTKETKNFCATITIIRVIEIIVSVGTWVEQGCVARVGVDVNGIFDRMAVVFDIISKVSTTILLSDTITSIFNGISLNLDILSKFKGVYGNSGCVTIVRNNVYPINGTSILINVFQVLFILSCNCRQLINHHQI